MGGASAVKVSVDELRKKLASSPDVPRVLYPKDSEPRVPRRREEIMPQPVAVAPKAQVSKPEVKERKGLRTLNKVELNYDTIMEQLRNGERPLYTKPKPAPVQEPAKQEAVQAQIQKPVKQEAVPVPVVAVNAPTADSERNIYLYQLPAPTPMQRSPLNAEQKMAVLGLVETAKYEKEISRRSGIPDHLVRHYLAEHAREEVVKKVMWLKDKEKCTWEQIAERTGHLARTLKEWVYWAGYRDGNVAATETASDRKALDIHGRAHLEIAYQRGERLDSAIVRARIHMIGREEEAERYWRTLPKMYGPWKSATDEGAKKPAEIANLRLRGGSLTVLQRKTMEIAHRDGMEMNAAVRVAHAGAKDAAALVYWKLLSGGRASARNEKG
jgi:hypothetical protein